MLSNHPGIPVRSYASPEARPRLIGYVLSPPHFDPGTAASSRLEEKCKDTFNLQFTEWDVGSPNNPIRVGLWRVLRRLVCNNCEPKRMSFSMLNFEDFLHQALSPCYCQNPSGLDGIVVSTINHLSNNSEKGTKLIIKLAQVGKHVIADDGICLSCCHPAALAMTNRAV